MPLNKRLAYGLVAFASGAVLVLSCVPAKVGVDVPATSEINPVGTNAAAPANGSILPASTGTDATTPSAAIQIVVPSGAIIKMQKALRTQTTGASNDFPAADLQKLVVQLDGRTLLPTEYAIGTPTYDEKGQLVLTVTFTPPPAKPTPVRVATANGTVTLLGQTSANGEPAGIDSFSTADALMGQLLVQPTTDAERQMCRDALAKAVTDTLTSSQKRPLHADAALLGMLQRLGAFLARGIPLTQNELAKIVTPISPTGGGGGASSFSGIQVSGSTSDESGGSTGGSTSDESVGSTAGSSSGSEPNTSGGGGDPGTGGGTPGSDESEGSESGGDPSTSGGGSSGGPPPGGG